ncbi:glycosyltransferase family 2 protein [Candidatus Parcubacteria bacterium]|nr:glycosyltransferase family 2 protein [Patescibacteria group bacterium]MCG2694440.1 glycosyltransferase family 2 protein [Candidatus Parcubacteria bacterium]
MHPKIGIIIVSYNSRPYLDDLFFSLSKITYPNFLIVFIDNASTDGSADYVKEKFGKQFSNLTILRSYKNLGFAEGNNVGFSYLEERGFDYAYLLNQDTAVSPDFLERALEKMDEKTGSVQSLIYLYNSAFFGTPRTPPNPPLERGGKEERLLEGGGKEERLLASSPEAPAWREKGGMKINTLGNAIHFLGFGYCYGYGWSKEKADKYLADWQKRDSELNIAYPSGAGTFFNMKALKKVGYFDEEFFMYHEDTDLGWRLRLAGYKNVLAPESVIHHKYEFSKAVKKYYFMERNRYLTIFKNYSATMLVLIAPALLVMELGLFIFSLSSGFWREKLRVYEYFLYPKNWSKICAKRRRTQKLRKAGDKEISKYFVGKILFQDMDNFILRKIVNPVFNCYWKIIKFFL